MNSPGGGRTSTAAIAVILAFAATRLWVLLLAPVKHDELDVLAQMGFEVRLASSQHESFYNLHARLARADAEQRQRAGGPPADPARQRVEYPPLAIAWIVLPTYFCHPLDTTRGLDEAHLHQYENAFRCLMAAVDAITFALLIWLVRRTRGSVAWQAGSYLACGAALFPVLYDRPDLLVGSLLLLTIALLIARSHWTIVLATLAVAINFKLVPILVAPLLIIAIAPAEVRSDRRRWLTAIVIRAATLLAMCVALFLPFYLLWGPRTLDFLTYHAERGVQVESVPATILLLSSNVTELRYTHGAIDLVSAAANVAGIISTIATTLLVLAVTVVMLLRAQRRREDASDVPITFIVLTFLVAMAMSKVFSPQYLLWIVPLVPLLPRAPAVQLVFLVTCALTTYIFPYHYWSDIARAVVEPPHYAILPPTRFGMALLTLRNGLLITAAVILAIGLRKQVRIEPACAAG